MYVLAVLAGNWGKISLIQLGKEHEVNIWYKMQVTEIQRRVAIQQRRPHLRVVWGSLTHKAEVKYWWRLLTPSKEKVHKIFSLQIFLFKQLIKQTQK